MTVHNKDILMAHHALAQLKLAHAAFVDSYPVHDMNSKLTVNRLLFVRDNDSTGTSKIRDPADGRVMPMLAGKLYFIPCKHSVALDIAPDLHFYSLQFNLDILYGVDLLESHPHCECLEVPETIAELEGLLKRETEFKTLCRINEIIYGFCVRWAPDDSEEIRRHVARSQNYADIIHYVKESGSAETTVEELANLKGMRKDVFSRKFASDIGLPPKDFIMEAMTRKASEMLLQPGISVKDVARELKFSSEYYFSHFFKRRTGTTPSDFQRANGLS